MLIVAVSKESRGSGLSDKLIKSAIDFYNKNKNILKVKYINWQCEQTNIASQKLAERNDFQKISETKNTVRYKYY